MMSTTVHTLTSRIPLKQEFSRKIIHMLGAFTVPLAYVDRLLTIILLVFVITVYLMHEFFWLKYGMSGFLGRIVQFTRRADEKDGPVLGPVTLALGVMLALILFPPMSATVAIFALSFGDGVSSLMGRLYGHLMPSLLKTKTVIGSASCFVAVFVSTWAVTRHFFIALFIALVVTIVEALPLGNFDNIAIPLVAGFSCYLLGF